jgi:hypothetical protein
MAGDTERARAILRDLEERARTGFVSPYHLAYVYTGLGEHDRAIDLLEHAIATRTGATYGSRGASCSSRCARIRGGGCCWQG